jgi:hypothetical protein
MPPMLVTFLVVVIFLPSAVNIDLNPKPERKDAAITKMINDVFFILFDDCFL